MPGETTSFIRPEDLWREVGLTAGQTVVHLGAGAGFFLIPAARFVGQSGKVIGIDILPDMLSEIENRARREGVAKTVHTIRANLELRNGSTLPDTMADWVLVANILHQSDPAKILGEAARIVQPTGAIIVVEWDVIATPLGPPTHKRVAKQVVEAVATKAHLAVDRSFSPSPYHYGLILKPQANS